MLNWDWDGEFWVAQSAAQDGGDHYCWRIGCGDDGLFSTGPSDTEVTTLVKLFSTLSETMKWCGDREGALRASFAAEAENAAAELERLRDFANSVAYGCVIEPLKVRAAAIVALGDHETCID